MTPEETTLAEELRDKLSAFIDFYNVPRSKIGYLMGLCEKYARDKKTITTKKLNVSIMKDFIFRHKKETWLTLTIKAYDYELAIINIEKCNIDLSEYDYIKRSNK